MDIDILFFKVSKLSSIVGAIRKLRTMERRKQYDIIHVHHGLKATFISMFSALPRVFTFHGTDILGYTMKKGLGAIHSVLIIIAAYITRFLARYAKAIIVMTEEMKQCLPKRLWDRVSVIPMGIDTGLFKLMDREEARRKLEWGNEPVVAFADNSTNHVKRPDIAKAAIAYVHQTMPGVRLNIIRGVPHEQIPCILAASDCLLVTSDMEGSPNVVRESIACSLPVVSVEVGDIPQLLQSFPGSGCIVSRNPENIAKSILSILESQQPRTYSTGVGRLSLQSIARQVVDIYTRILAKDETVK